MLKKLLFAIFVLNLGACCTKMYCSGSWDIYTFEWEYPTGSQQNKFIVFDSTYSTVYYSSSRDMRSDMRIRSLPFVTYGKVAFVIESDSRIDTIWPVKYSGIIGKTACNKCFPFGYDSQESKQLQSFEFWYGGKKYGISDTLRL